MVKGYTVNRKPIRHNGTRYLANDFIPESELTDTEVKRLLTLNAITKAIIEDDEHPEGLVEQQNEGTNVILNKGEGVLPFNVTGVADPGEEPIEVTLDLNFKLDELKDGAVELGLDFAGNISKKKLIALIIEHKKTEYFLSQLED